MYIDLERGMDPIIRGGADGLDGLYDANIRRKWG
jgi:hypothetical protein